MPHLPNYPKVSNPQQARRYVEEMRKRPKRRTPEDSLCWKDARKKQFWEIEAVDKVIIDDDDATTLTVEEARDRAIHLVLATIHATADHYGLCPLCLTYAVAELTGKAEDRGSIHHLVGEEETQH